MTPFFFGSSANSLYGVLHEPSGRQFRDSAVIMLHPLGHEYFRTYRMLRTLADTLSSQGYFVLRFDYRGTGDSSGDFAQVMPDDLLEDIELALSELAAVSAQTRLVGIGIRFGANLLLKAKTYLPLDHAILWDPCLDGERYLSDLSNLTTKLLANLFWFKNVRHLTDLVEGEHIGVEFSQACQQSIREMCATDYPHDTRTQYHLLTTSDDASVFDFHQKLQQSGCSSYCKQFSDMGNWQEIKRLDSSITTPEILKYIAGVMR